MLANILLSSYLFWKFYEVPELLLIIAFIPVWGILFLNEQERKYKPKKEKKIT